MELLGDELLSAVALFRRTSALAKPSGFRAASRRARHAPKLSATIVGRRRGSSPRPSSNAASKAAAAAATSGSHGSSSLLFPSPSPKSKREDQTSKPASDSRAAWRPRETPVPSAPGMWTSGGHEG